MEKIEQRLLRFLRTGDGDFGALALELFAYQFALNAPYQAYARQIGKSPETVKTWKDIPAVSVSSFKSVNLATFPVAQAAAHFESSGTTHQTRSHHYLKSLTCYETSLKAGFEKAVLPDGARYTFLILTPSPAEAPRSSLSWMMDVVRRQSALGDSSYFVTRGRLDEPFLLKRLLKVVSEGKPVVLLGTTLAWIGFLEYLDKNGQRLQLPKESRLMDTGGMKTETREISRARFVTWVGECLGIPEPECINEYGMCELSSQWYGRGTSSYLEGAPWTRTLVIDPVTGEEASAGQPGLLRHFDLANVDSVLAVQTEDVGVAEGNGFLFQGRNPHAEMRGCSIPADTFIHA